MPRSKRLDSNNILSGSLDLNDIYVMREAANYLLNILRKTPLMDKDTLEFACWILGPKLEELIQEIESSLKQKDKRNFRFEVEEVEDLDDYARAICRIIKNNKRLANKVLKNIIQLLQERLTELVNRKESDLEKNARLFKQTFNLSDNELALCTFYFLIENWDNLGSYFSRRLNVDKFSGRKYLLAALDLQSRELENLVSGNLSKLGIIQRQSGEIELDSDFLSLFVDPYNPVQPDSLYKKVDKGDLPLKLHQVTEENIQLILGLLKEKNDVASHFLLYGPPGTGKTSFAKALLETITDPKYEITLDSSSRIRHRIAAITSCLNMTNNSSGSVLLVDEADNLLSTSSTFLLRGDFQDKGWLNRFMEQPGVRVIWIVNSLEDIADSVLRRFAYSLYFPKFSRQKRHQLWKTIIKHNKVGRYIKDPAIKELAEEYEVSAGVIDLAVKQAKASSATPKLSFLDRVKMGLNSHLRLQNQGTIPKNENRLDKNFSLQGLNIQGNLEYTLNQLRHFHETKALNQVKQYNLLFYGPPGTGKSELAKYISKELDRDLIIKRASDLLDPYVGMTERHIADMFSDAEAKEAVLVLDEADSFVFGRDKAVRSWEVSHVNEFLTQMEKYQGILICTTNRFKDLDQASVRRFNQKLFFDYLNHEGIQIFYDKFLSNLCTNKIDKDLSDKLLKFKRLTPGDFKNIRDRYILEQAKVTHADMISALEEEERIKIEQQGAKKVGF